MSLLPIFVFWILTLQAAHSYVLLSANVEDLQALAKEIAGAPILKQMKYLFRAANEQFHRVSRAGDEEADVENRRIMEAGKKAKKYLRTAISYFKSNFYDN